jgi:ketosteroid isomerase-like protein
MSAREHLWKLKAGYAAWNDSLGDSLDVWREMMDERFRLTSIDETSPGMGFAADRDTREDALDYLAAIFDEWEMVHYTPQTYVCEGDNIAVFGKCAYRYRRTGKVAECRIACLWRFKDGKAIEMTDIWDTAVAAAATVA